MSRQRSPAGKWRVCLDARFVSHPQPGGFKTYSVNLVKAMGELETDMTFVVYLDRLPTGEDLPQSRSFQYEIVRGNIPIVGMPWREEVGIRLRLRRDRPDLVHFLCNTATLGLGLPFVVTLHDTIQLEKRVTRRLRTIGAWKSFLIGKYSQQNIVRSIKGAARVITVSRAEKDIISRDLGIDSRQIAVTAEAPASVFVEAPEEDRKRWRREVETTLGLRGPFLLGVGYERRKNIELLIDAFAHLSCADSQLRLVVVAAEGMRRELLRQRAIERGVGGRCIFLESASSECLLRLYNLATVFVFPSLRESFGLPLVEAMACGLPTIAMRASATPEVVGDGALLLDSTDAEVWASAIRTVVESPSASEELRERGLRRVASMTWKRCAEETVAIYRAVLEERAGYLRLA